MGAHASAPSGLILSFTAGSIAGPSTRERGMIAAALLETRNLRPNAVSVMPGTTSATAAALEAWAEVALALDLVPQWIHGAIFPAEVVCFLRRRAAPALP